MAKKLFLGTTVDKQQISIIRDLQDNFEPAVRLVPAANLHMTLAFFGLVSVEKQLQLEAQLSALCKAKFSVTLDTLTYWRKPRALCITGQANDKGLLKIVDESQSIAASLGLHESEHTFTAHITVARKVEQMPASQASFEPLIIAPIAIHLFESKSSDQGVEYHVVRSWDLH